MSKGFYNNPHPCVDCEKGPWYAGRGCGCADFCHKLGVYETKRDLQAQSQAEIEKHFMEKGYIRGEGRNDG